MNLTLLVSSFLSFLHFWTFLDFLPIWTEAAPLWVPGQWHTLALTDEQMSRLELRGRTLICAMRGNDESAGAQLGDTRTPPSAESIFDTSIWHKRMDRWHWFQTESRFSSTRDVLGWGAVTERETFGNGDWVFKRWVHGKPWLDTPIASQTYTSGNTEPGALWTEHLRRATGAEVDYCYNRPKGMMIIIYQEECREAAIRNWGIDRTRPDTFPRPDDLPHLHALGDLLYSPYVSNIRWNYLQNLERLGINRVSQRAVLGVIARILLDRSLEDLEEWPALNSYVFADTYQGRAMLGTQIGLHSSLLLIRHKGKLGIRHIKGFRIFRSTTIGNEYLPNILFEIEDVPDAQRSNVNIPLQPGAYNFFPVARSVSRKDTLGNTSMYHSSVESVGPKNILRQHTVHI